MTPQQQQFLRAGEQYVAQTRQNKDVIGIIFTGSFIHGQLDANSDLDVFVILAPACNYRERGNTWINGVEVEYFMNPPQQIRGYMQQEKSPHTAHMLAHGRLVYCTTEVVVQLMQEAKTRLATPPPAMKQFEIELARYHLDDLFKDLEDALACDDQLAAGLLKTTLINTGIDLFCKRHRLYRDKHKRLYHQLAGVDPLFAQLLLQLIAHEQWHLEDILPLKKYITDLLGGERSREWKLRSALDL
ncbi:MAG: hypothetical protein R2824_04185 [Saprospiraceae bacterium]|nr:hypothetical protein [Lewinella sp.]